MKKRLCGIFLVLALILCQVPQAALAAEEGAAGEQAAMAAEEGAAGEQAAMAAEEGAAGEQSAMAEAAAVEEAAEEVITEATGAEAGEDEAEEPAATVAEAEIASTSFFGVLISDAEGSMNTGGSYHMDYPGMEGDPSRTSSSNNFVEDGNGVYIEAYPADGYKFVGWYQGDPDRAEGKLYVGEPLTTDRAYQFDAPIDLERPYICAVFDVDDSPQGDQVMMWVGNTEVIGPNSAAQGGKVAVKYTPSYDVYPESITARDGTDFVAGEILQFYKGDECTVYAKADQGYSFIGWYHVNIEWRPGEDLAWEGDVISTGTSFTYKPGVTVVPGDTEPLRYVCAVFEKAVAKTCTVSFDPGTGTGSMAPVTVDAGAEYELPSCAFTHTNTQRTFYRWSVDGELKDPGETITVSKDTVVTAKWLDTGRAKTIDNSVDRSTTEVVGTLSIKDTGTGEVIEEITFDEVTASAFTEPSNPTVKAMIVEAGESATARAKEIAGGNVVTTISESVTDPRIDKTINKRTSTFFVEADGADDYATYIIIDGEWAHLWRYDVTIEAEYESAGRKVTVTTDGNGTASASVASGVSGTEVTLTAKPAAGYRFYKWEVVSGGVSVKNNAFTIGDKDVEIKALFGKIPGKSEKVTVYNVAQGIKVTWLKVPDATSYYIYRDNLDGKGYKFLFRTSALEVTDLEVRYELGKKFRYKVLATSKYGGDAEGFRTSTYYRLMPTGITSVTNSGAGKMTVTYDKSSGGSGYVVRYGLKQDMSDAKVITVKGENTTSRTFSGLKKGQTYYVQVRTYKIEDGIRYYSGYCLTKKVKIVK